MAKRWSKSEDDQLIELAKSLSHKEMAEIFATTVGAVRNRCWRIGAVDKSKEWDDCEIDILKNAYKDGAFVDVHKLASQLSRTTDSIQVKASKLGITDSSRKKLEVTSPRVALFATKEERATHKSLSSKEWLRTHAHPKGALGMKHSDEAKEMISEKSKMSWSKKTQEQRQEMVVKQMKTRVANGTDVFERPGASWKSGWREIGGVKKYYRSKWEANYAYYLQWLKEKGQIAQWLHEPVTFWFEGVKRGCVSYLPDFWVLENNGEEAYHEVKGWMDDRSKTKIKRMAKYHSKVKLIVIDSKGYAALKKSVQGLVPGWEA